MRTVGRPTRELTASMALLAVAAAVCLSVPAGAVVASGLPQGPVDRRTATEADEAVASFIECLSHAAKTLAGQTAAVIETGSQGYELPVAAPVLFTPAADLPVFVIQPHVFLLNLPPPAALS